jgi:[CysO sulfur-carrier protein]-S-L-cysteine hydrolase
VVSDLLTQHPGPQVVALPVSIVQQLIDQARTDYPNEACGIVAGSALPSEGGLATRWFPARNEAASPLRYNIHPQDLLRIYNAIDDASEEVWAIVHSHVRSPARPSPTDIGQARNWPDALYILVSLAETGRDPAAPDPAIGDPAHPSPSVRAWRIVGDQIFEVALEVTG